MVGIMNLIKSMWIQVGLKIKMLPRLRLALRILTFYDVGIRNLYMSSFLNNGR